LERFRARIRRCHTGGVRFLSHRVRYRAVRVLMSARARVSGNTRRAPDGTPLRPAHYPKHREAKYNGKNRNKNQAHDCPRGQARRRDRQGSRRRSNRCGGESRDRGCAGEDQRGACRGPRKAHAIKPGDQARRRKNRAAKPRQACQQKAGRQEASEYCAPQQDSDRPPTQEGQTQFALITVSAVR
jgi:hypothetical protein